MSEYELNRRFSDSDYGLKLEENVRFGDFKPDYIDNDIWEYLLGDDVNNLRHMAYTYELTKRFAQAERIGNELLKLTAITHDWGEAVVGDVALPDKDLSGPDEAEANAYRQIAYEIAPDYDLSQVPEVLWGEHELTEPFNAIEYMGYCQTGLRAGRMACLLAGGLIDLSIPRKQIDGLLGGLLSLNKQVELKNFKKLAGYADKYRSIERLMI